MTLKTGWVVFLDSGLSIAGRRGPARIGTSPGRKPRNLPSVSPIWRPRYEFFRRSGRKNKFERHAKPLLTYSNPISGTSSEKRLRLDASRSSEMIGAIFDFRSEDKLDSEFHSLSLHGIVATRDGKHSGNPEQPGIEFRPVPNAPAACGERVGAGEADARKLIRGFTVRIGSSGTGSGELRMLTQPIYRYASPENDVHRGSDHVFVSRGPILKRSYSSRRPGKKPRLAICLRRMTSVEFRGT